MTSRNESLLQSDLRVDAEQSGSFVLVLSERSSEVARHSR